MATESELRQEIADERRKLTSAVESLREQIDNTTERGKKIGTAVGAAAGAALALRTALRIRRHFRD
jgi:flagellar biosynthesis/type III secretory pathway protein FliH